MMKYDVFISYSRKDSEITNRIYSALTRAGVSCFIDRENIRGGRDFTDVIMEAIDDAKLFLFIGSKNSYSAQYAPLETKYAFDEQKTIVPYLIDNTPLPRTFRFYFGTINILNIEEHPIETTLVEDVLDLLGKESPVAIEKKKGKTLLLLIEKIIFQSEDNDAVILSGKENNGKTRQVIGTLHDPAVGSIIKASGFWKRHNKYGWQFKAEEISVLSQDPTNDQRESLQCKIVFVKELRQDTGFCSASGVLTDESKVRLSGRLKNMRPGIDVYALGEWHEDEQYGREFRVKQWEYFKPVHPGVLQKCMEMIKAVKMANDSTCTIKDFNWKNVQMKDNFVIVPYPEGQATWCILEGARESYNNIKSYLDDRLPALQVSFDEQGYGTVLNAGIIRDAVTLMHVTHTLRYGEMETREKNRDIIERVREMSPEATREFVPREVTPYLDFLQENQSEYFNIVPIEEYNGGSRENAFLFTIMINDRPYIVWENTNLSRASFVFSCEDETYNEKLETICSFIADERKGKRNYMHSDASRVTFGEKPVLLVHNTFDSWAERLLAINK